MSTPKHIALLGATGSIGTQTLDIIRANPDKYILDVVAAGSRVDELVAICHEFNPRLAVIAEESLLPKLRQATSDLDIECEAGAAALADAVELDGIDLVVTATVGYAGLEPTIRAIKRGCDIALANKETLVVAGDLINRLLQEAKTRIFPVDSEHSAIAQCLIGESPDSVSRLIITASGGPFRTWSAQRIAQATATDALKHPNWTMGAKITIDSATMMNKAFEIIEAHHLFGVAPEKIEALVHPQSIVHSMVEFVDGAIKAQLGVPDMHLPIAYAMGENTRLPGVERKLTLSDITSLTFEAPDFEKFPCLSFAEIALTKKGTIACAINAANEIANAAFRKGQIEFGDIYPLILKTTEQTSFVQIPTMADYIAVNQEARERATLLLSNF